MQHRRLVGLIGGFLLLTTLATADEEPPLGAGARVRVKMSNAQGSLVGGLLALDNERLTLQIENEKAPRVLPRAEVTALAVSGGRRSRGRGALIGAGVGAVVGAVIGFAGGDDPDVDEGGMTASQNAVEGAGIFGVMGALIGLAVPPGERWREVPLDRVRVSLLPVRGRGVRVSVAVHF
jgi:hypothetical protein